MTDSHASPPPARFNLSAHLLQSNAARGAKTAYIDDRARLSYAELERRVRQFAKVLRDRGLRREERVLLLAHDTVDWPVAFLGCIYAGVVPVAVNTLLTADDYAYMLEHSRARAVIVGNALAPTITQAMQRSPHDIAVIWVIGATAGLPEGRRDFAADIEAAEGVDAPAPTHADEPAFWLYSSGSTGAPKGTVHTHANAYWTDALYARNVLRLTDADVVFSERSKFANAYVALRWP